MPDKIYIFSENGMAMLEEAYGILDDTNFSPISPIKAKNLIKWFLGNEVCEHTVSVNAHYNRLFEPDE